MLNVTNTRPLGVTIIAIIVAIYGILAIIGGVLLLHVSATVGLISLVLGILELALAWGLWTLQKWAFWATVVLEALALLNGLLALSQGGGGDGIVGIIIALVVLIYLFADPNVRAAFRT